MTSGNVAIQVQARLRWLNNPPNEVQKVNLDGKIGHFGQSFGVAVIARAPARGVFFFDNHAHADAAFGDHPNIAALSLRVRHGTPRFP
jgi:hypothetical protein